MANKSDLTRKEQVLKYLQDRSGQWVDGTVLATERVGGSEGLKRLRELRQDGHRIVMRAHPDPERNIFQYKLVVPDGIHPRLLDRLSAGVNGGSGSENGAGPADAAETRNGAEVEVARDQIVGASASTDRSHSHGARSEADKFDLAYSAPEEPSQSPSARSAVSTDRPRSIWDGFNPSTGRFEVIPSECPDCHGIYDDEAAHVTSVKHQRWLEKHEQGQQRIDVPPQPDPGRYTQLPERVELGTSVLCPRCLGKRRKTKRRWNKKTMQWKEPVDEEFTRDPERPTAKNGEPNRCVRCGGLGIVPAVGV